MTVYECEECETALGPGWMACPRCGQPFDEPVPDDATLPQEEALEEERLETESPAEEMLPVSPSEPDLFLPPSDLPLFPRDLPPPLKLPPPRSRPPCRMRLPRLAAAMLGIVTVLGLGWAGVRGFALLNPPSPAPVVSALPPPLSDLRAHPAYASDMAAFVEKLRASGVAAQWPAFGGSDTLLITPPTVVGEQRAVWNADLYKQLAQGIYANFWEKRYETGFSDSDSTTCFVLVCDESGKIVAADLMGNVV